MMGGFCLCRCCRPARLVENLQDGGPHERTFRFNFFKIPPAALKENQTHITEGTAEASAQACCPPAPTVVRPCPPASTRLGLQSPWRGSDPAAAEASDPGAF